MRKENEVVLSYRWKFQDGRSKGMGTEWDNPREIAYKVPNPLPVERGKTGSFKKH